MDDDDITVMRSSHSHHPQVPPGSDGRDLGGDALPVGTRLGEFEITGLIGEGGFGIVYLAHDTSPLQRKVAIKEFMPAGMASRSRTMQVTVRSQSQAETFRMGLRSFVNEARLLASFDSPSLVKVHQFWEGNGTAYMVMPYYEGVTLRQSLKDRQVVPDERWLRAMLASLCDALETIHREQCFHRDIAPDNIMILHRDGRPVLLDFGAARRVVGDATQSLTVILKPGFAPIEQYADAPGMRQGAWTDVYALAAVVYFIISGKTPLPAVARIVSDELVPAREVGLGRYSGPFLAAIDRALAVRPEHRFQSIAQFREALGLQEGAPRTMPEIGQAPLPANAAFDGSPRWATEPPYTTRGRGTAGSGHTVPPSGDWGRTEFRPPAEPPRRSAVPYAVGALAAVVLVAAGVGGYRFLSGPGAAPSSVVEAPPARSEAQVPAAPPVAEVAPRPAEDKPAPPAAKPPEVVAAAPVAPVVPATPQAEAARPPAAAVTATPAAPAAPVVPPATAALDPDDELWRVAALRDTASAYEAYLKRFPRGRHAASAQVMLESRQAKAPVAAASNPVAQPPAVVAAPARPAEAAPQANAKAPPPQAEAKTAASSAPLSPLPPTQVSGAGPAAGPQGQQVAAASGQSSPQAPRTQDPPAAAAAAPAAAKPAGKEPAAEAPAKEPPKEEVTAALSPQAGAASRTIRLADQVLTGDFTQDPASGFVSGTGQVVWNNGNRYEGRLVKGMREGKGRFFWPNGSRYSGDWAADAPNGRGILEFGNGDRYEGDVKNGVPHGQGTMRFGSGSVYTGAWSNGNQDGQGTLRFASGDSYAGAWLNGRHHGKGRYTWTNGTYWEGEFKEDRTTENGKTVFPDGRTEAGAAVRPTAR